MTASTRKSSKMPRPRKPSAKARANSSKISKVESKQRVVKKFINPDSTPNLGVAASSTPTLTAMSYPMLQMMPQAFQYPYGLLVPYAQLRLEAPPHRHEERSSSVCSGTGSGVEKLARYIVWLAKKYPTLATSLFEAEKALIGHDFIFETVEHITDDEFLRMGVTGWITALLRTQTKRFKKAEAR